METTARRALSELIDQLCTPQPEPQQEPVAEPPAPVLAAVPVAVDLPLPVPHEPVPEPVPELPVQRAPEPPRALPSAVTVLPGPARSAILWRSRSA